MSARPLAVLRIGLVTPVGFDAPASCAAIRAKLANPQETRFMDAGGEWMMGHSVHFAEPVRGNGKLIRMAAMVIEECLTEIPKALWPSIPLWLCVAESERPGRPEGLEDQLYLDICAQLDVEFAADSAIVSRGRVSVATALERARALIYEQNIPQVLIVGTDSLLHWPTLAQLEDEQRLLTSENSNGFIPGEAAGAILVGKPQGAPALLCHGIGFGKETATVSSEEPLRGDGLVAAMRAALGEAGVGLHQLDFRITDLSGEQYYFKEAALALSRVLRERKEEFDIWHAAECIGETGAAAGMIALAVADVSCRKEYAPGNNILLHVANDDGERAALVLGFGMV